MWDNQEIWIEIIKVIPSFLWVAFAFVTLFLVYEPLVNHLLPYVSSLRIGNVEIFLGRFEQSLDRVIEIAEKNPQWQVEVPDEAKEQVIRRIRRHWDLLQGSRVLLFDDRPDTLVNEISMLQQLDMQVETVTSVSEAREKLKTAHFDLLVSDIARPEGQSNGIATLQTLHDYHPDIPAIFYVGNFNAKDGVPAGAFGITNRPDELVHLMLDILERKRL